MLAGAAPAVAQRVAAQVPHHLVQMAAVEQRRRGRRASSMREDRRARFSRSAQNCSTNVVRKSASRKRSRCARSPRFSRSTSFTMRSSRWLFSWMMVSRRAAVSLIAGLLLQQLGGVADRAERDCGSRARCWPSGARARRASAAAPAPARGSGPRGRSPRRARRLPPDRHEARALALAVAACPAPVSTPALARATARTGRRAPARTRRARACAARPAAARAGARRAR